MLLQIIQAFCQPPLCLLTEVTNWLKFKEKSVEVVQQCTDEEINELLENIQQIDFSVLRADRKQALLKSLCTT